jgi:hypothetical protein
MAPTLQGPLGIDQHIGDVLDIADLPFSATDLQQRIVGSAGGVGPIEQQDSAEPRPPAGGQRPVFALDVVDDRGTGPGQQRRDDEPDTLTRSGGSETQDVLGTIMAKIMIAQLAEHHAVVAEQAGFANSRGSAQRAEP